MNDADQTIDVSLETDRLEQLLEVPAPAQPVVMIEYRSRGVPWWFVVTLIVLVPLAAVVCYQQLVVQRYQAKAADVAYQLAQKMANDNAAQPPRSDAPPAEPVGSTAAPGLTPIMITAEAAPPATAKPPSSPSAVSDGNAQPVAADVSSDLKVAGAPEPQQPRVQTIFRPLESVDTKADPRSAGTDRPVGPPSHAPGRTMPSDDSVNTKLASLDARPPAAQNSGPRQDGPAAKAAAGESPPDAAAGGAGPADRGPAIPPVEPLPTADEFRRQNEEEAAKKKAEKIEEQVVLLDRCRARKFDDRVRFHEELGRLVNSVSDHSAKEIDALVKQYRGSTDPRTYAAARKIWRSIQLPVATRVTRMRLLDVTESDVLDFITDNFYARMHTRGGPRDANEVRLWAARLLLKYGPSDDAVTKAPASGPASSPRNPKIGDSPPG